MEQLAEDIPGGMLKSLFQFKLPSVFSILVQRHAEGIRLQLPSEVIKHCNEVFRVLIFHLFQP